MSVRETKGKDADSSGVCWTGIKVWMRFVFVSKVFDGRSESSCTTRKIVSKPLPQIHRIVLEILEILEFSPMLCVKSHKKKGTEKHPRSTTRRAGTLIS